ncbi:MAG: hypothetical protein ACKO4L_11315 [Nodosilinea sp.]
MSPFLQPLTPPPSTPGYPPQPSPYFFHQARRKIFCFLAPSDPADDHAPTAPELVSLPVPQDNQRITGARMTEQQMPLRVGYKAAYRKEMTWVVGTIAALEGDLALLDSEPTPSLPVEPNPRVRIAVNNLFPPF